MAFGKGSSRNENVILMNIKYGSGHEIKILKTLLDFYCSTENQVTVVNDQL